MKIRSQAEMKKSYFQSNTKLLNYNSETIIETMICGIWYATNSIYLRQSFKVPITVAARFKTWIVFARSNAGIVGSNPTRGMDVRLRLSCVCVVLCVPRSLELNFSKYVKVCVRMGESNNQGSSPSFILITSIRTNITHCRILNMTSSERDHLHLM
jgi:hypothetical protein